MLARLRGLRHVAPRGARLLAHQADAVTPYRELTHTTAAQREVSSTRTPIPFARWPRMWRMHIGNVMSCSGPEGKSERPLSMPPPLVSLRQAWSAQDELLHARMKEHVPAALEHNGEESFANHLVGVQSVLRSWNASDTLCDAAWSACPGSQPPTRPPTAPKARLPAQG